MSISFPAHFELFAFAFVFLCLGFFAGWMIGRIIRARALKAAGQNAVRRSAETIRGHAYEKILPYLPDFPYDPSDMIFVGRGVDYIVFDGLSRWGVGDVVFLEVKSWRSRLSTRERSIADAIAHRRVRYETYRLWRE